MFEGDLEDGELEIGQIIGLINKIQPASKIVKEIISEFNFEKNNLSDQQMEKLIAVAKGCPVAQSLSKDLVQEFFFNF